MTVRVAINGFGRIGRLVLRAFFEYDWQKDLQIVALNGSRSLELMAHLFKYDSVHGRFQGDIKVGPNSLIVNDVSIPVTFTRDPRKLPYKNIGVDVALECTGQFRERQEAAQYLSAGAKRVLIAAPGKNADFTAVYGVNHQNIEAEHRIVSNASCTTNCLAPVVDILNKAIGIKHGITTTVHAYTGDQNLVDKSHKDLRRARAAGLSMIPTSTGAARSVGVVLPEMRGKLSGTAIRVPTANVSLIDFVFEAAQDTTVVEVNNAVKKAIKGDYKNIVGISDEPLVSTDFVHSPESTIFDMTQTEVLEDRMVRILAWYDNEWGFSCRMLDMAKYLGQFKG